MAHAGVRPRAGRDRGDPVPWRLGPTPADARSRPFWFHANRLAGRGATGRQAPRPARARATRKARRAGSVSDRRILPAPTGRPPVARGGAKRNPWNATTYLSVMQPQRGDRSGVAPLGL